MSSGISAANLPVVVLERIIDALASYPEDIKALGNTSLTCRHLSSYCRRYIFSTIHLLPRMLDGYQGQRIHRHLRLKTLENLVASSPEISGYVRSLAILMHSSNFNDEGFPRLLQKLNNIQKLTIRTLHIDGKRCFQNWMEMPYETQQALWGLIHQQRLTLKDLEFFNFVEIPAAIILTLTSLQHLRLMESHFHPIMAYPHNSYIHEGPIQLESLAFTQNYESIAPLFYFRRSDKGQEILDLSLLKLLSGIYDPSPAGVVEESMPFSLKGMHQLENLDLSSLSRVSVTPFPLPVVLASIDPDALKTIHTLCFQIWIGDELSLIPEHLPTTILRNIRPLPALRYLGISISIVFPISSDTPLRDDFGRLDTLLSSPQYSSLSSVYICLSFFGPNMSFDLQSWRSIPRTLMPLLSRKPSPFNFVFLPE